MSSAEIAAQLLTKIDSRELRILQGIELGMSEYEFVPIEIISKYSGLNENEVKYWINELDKKEVLWRQSENYVGYILNYSGYDILALNAMVKSNTLEALGNQIGVGKEADVYEAFTQNNEKVAIKFHRLGRTSFRDTRRKRAFFGKLKHISWLYQSRLAAEKEYKALKKMITIGDFVPKPIDYNRHIIIMEYIDGVPLSDIKSLNNPEKCLNEIIQKIFLTYKNGIIHNDLSKYNILIIENEDIKIID
ncbi:hypothetical protein JW865_01600, partial [Candidatus Bathyarchaeota archaeon]|nr:hypothetical protein [Candidatus Bathyarchaeota archaeon]